MYPNERLVMKQTEIKIMSLFKQINQEIDRDHEKLSDKIKTLQKSHNSLCRTLERIKKYTNDEFILALIDQAFYQRGPIKQNEFKDLTKATAWSVK